ncbi:MAG: hypothetical protein NTY48_04685, partial [Candidatus Diapherotrites archaeon]|nr:hypothetical protein [Candidatus Diapherotrites archaeon]
LGLKDREFEKNLSLFAFSIQASTPRELIARVLETKELTDYEKLRAERFLMIIDKTLPRLFGTQVPTEELTKTIPGKLGRAVVIDTKGLSQEEKAIFIQTIFRQITRSVSETKQISCVIFVPQADELITQNTDRIATAILRVENRGVGVVLGTEKELPESISQTITTRMSIVSGKDAAISIKGKRNYRVVLRSNLSGGTKLR